MKKYCVTLLLLLLSIFSVCAKNIDVRTLAELKISLLRAVSGDVIRMTDATYQDADITIAASGITLKAATDGGVIFTGKTMFKVSGNKNTIRGFQFKNIDIAKAEVVEIAGSNNLLLQCNFFNCTSRHYIHTDAGSHDNEIRNCNIEAKPRIMNGDCAIQITTSPTVISHTKIRYCTFLNFEGEGGDFGNEPIRIGRGSEQNNISGCVVEYCYFENLGLGDSESISVKSTSNVLRYNTCNKNPKAQFVFRTGNKNSAYGNFFIHSGGIRVKEGGNHMIYNNYFEGEAEFASLQLMNFKLNPKTKTGDPLSNIFVYHNTFYNPGKIRFGGAGKNPPENIQFINNLIHKDAGTILTDTNPGTVFRSNLYAGNASLGIPQNKREFLYTDLKLVKNSFGYYSLSEQSPAVNHASGNYPAIVRNTAVENDADLLLDLAGKPRPKKRTEKDIGSNEFTSGEPLNHPLNRREAGPSYL